MPKLAFYAAMIIGSGIAFAIAGSFIEHRSTFFPQPFLRLLLHNMKYCLGVSILGCVMLAFICMLEAACL